MAEPVALDQARQRRHCEHCSLGALCLPAGLDAHAMGRLDQIVRRRRPVRRGERLFRIGDPLLSIYLASEGALKTVGISEEGEEQVLAFHLPGEVFGLDALGTGAHRCEAVALVDGVVCEVPYELLSSTAPDVPGLQQQLLRIIGQSVGRDQDHVALLVRRQANERIAIFLHGLGERFARIGRSATQFQLPMRRDEIARYLGLALETVSRGFTRLQEDGVIAVEGRRIAILDGAELVRIAHGVADAEVDRRATA